MRRLAAVLAAGLLSLCAGQARAATKYGDLTFPADEHGHPPSWEYWWGAADLVAKSGNRYILTGGLTSLDGDMVAAWNVYPLQGPYRGQGIMSLEGPPEWGHENPAGRIVYTTTNDVPGVDQLLKLDTYDLQSGMKLISRWERTSLERPTYRLMLDQNDGSLHPAGGRVDMQVDLRARMRTPLLAGGTGRWFYGVPEDYGNYPSRAFQYQQVAKRLAGTLRMTMPDGTVLDERVRPRRSHLTMTHEYNPVEAIPTGIALALSSQVNARYFQSYNLQWPWELVYVDLGNGAQLMFDLQTYHDTPRGFVKLSETQPTYRVLATLRLRNGTSVRLDDKLHAEHLAMRSLDSIASAAGNTVGSPWVQGWRYRISYRGGRVRAPSGKMVRVPPFDLGFKPVFTKSEPLADESNNRQTQRVPFDVSGHYGGCPVHGFAWSELLANWFGWEDYDPWFTGGRLPKTPRRCGDKVPQIPTGTPGNLNPPPQEAAPPDVRAESCTADENTPRCELRPEGSGGIAASGTPGGWRVTITRPGRPVPYVLNGYGGGQAYPCGTIRKGDFVVAEAEPGSSVTVGNPGICF
jgi:hypothetical protein